MNVLCLIVGYFQSKQVLCKNALTKTGTDLMTVNFDKHILIGFTGFSMAFQYSVQIGEQPQLQHHHHSTSKSQSSSRGTYRYQYGDMRAAPQEIPFTDEQLEAVKTVVLSDADLMKNDVPVTAVVACLMAQMAYPGCTRATVGRESTHISVKIDMTEYTQPGADGPNIAITTISGDCIRRIAALNAATQFEPIVNVQLQIDGEKCTLV